MLEPAVAGRAGDRRPAHGELPGDRRRVPGRGRPRPGGASRRARARAVARLLTDRRTRRSGWASARRALVERNRGALARDGGRAGGAGRVSALLAPLGARLRRRCRPPRGPLRRGASSPATRLRSPVISVGNLAVGGRGKTPVVELVAATPARRGPAGGRPQPRVRRRPSAATPRRERRRRASLADGRGGGGRARDARARRLPGVVVAVGRDRVRRRPRRRGRASARACTCSTTASSTCASRATSTSCASTRGDLRATAAARGTAARAPVRARRAPTSSLVSGGRRGASARAAAADALRSEPDASSFRVRRRPAGFVDLAGGVRLRPRARPFLLAGIARPERFVADVRAAGHDGRRARAFFRDHHAFRPTEIEAGPSREAESAAPTPS